MVKKTNIYWHERLVNQQNRENLHHHKGVCLWFTGLSGSGKSTIAINVEKKLFNRGISTYVLDGDNIRHGLNKDLGFSPKDREENIRRIGEVAKLFVDAGLVVMTAFISPYRADRQIARSLFADGEFYEIFIDASIETCEKRDPKGLYKKARAGEINDFTGISAPYEIPKNPELIVQTTTEENIDSDAEKVMQFLINKGLAPAEKVLRSLGF